MDENNSIQLFEDRKIRTAWDEEKEEWYFSVVDVVAVLSDSANPTDYLKKNAQAGRTACKLPGDKLSPGRNDRLHR